MNHTTLLDLSRWQWAPGEVIGVTGAAGERCPHRPSGYLSGRDRRFRTCRRRSGRSHRYERSCCRTPFARYG
jgi:hypothetical protein